MKHYVYITICLLMTSMVSGGCKKSPNSDIEGFWQLLEFTTLEDGEVHECERLYYSIQLWVVEIAQKQGTIKLDHEMYRGRYSYDEDANTVSMTDFSTYPNVNNDTSVVAELSDLKHFGLNSVNTTFDVISVNKRSMVLESDYARLTFKRF